MAEYHVAWEAELEADSPQEAAEEAFRLMQDPGTSAMVFTVARGDRRWQVDLKFGDARCRVKDLQTGEAQFYPL
jgi:hypothetical protein